MTQEAYMYVVGLLHLVVFVVTGAAYLQYAFVGVVSVIVGLLMRSDVLRLVVRYLKMAVALVSSYSVLVLLWITPTMHGFSAAGILLILLFVVLLIISLIMLYQMTVYGDRWSPRK
jgi:hypothetical protein